MRGDFVFHGVGQGLFYSGTIEDGFGKYSLVYDCGTISKNTVLKEKIDLLPDDIDMLVISHLHKDHVRGLPYLFNKKKVKKLYLPYFDVRTYRNVFLAYLIDSGIEIGSDLFNLLLQLYDVSYEGEHARIDIGDNTGIEQIGGYIGSNNHGWSFEFYNKLLPTEIIDTISKNLNELTGGNDIARWYIQNGDLKSIHLIFKDELRGRHNLSSLVLIHYPPYGAKTVLTGDVLSDAELNERIESSISDCDSIVLQIPHHGAYREYKAFSEKCIGLSKEVIIPCGIGNRYKHPSPKTVESLNNVHAKIIMCQNDDYAYSI